MTMIRILEPDLLVLVSRWKVLEMVLSFESIQSFVSDLVSGH